MASIKVNFSKEAYVPGDTIQGDLLLSIPVASDKHWHFEISGIYLQLQGYERIRFRRRADSSSKSTDNCIDDDGGVFENLNHKTVSTGIPTILPISQPHFSQANLVCLTSPVTRLKSKLAPGMHSFPFAVALPTRLPPSLQFSSGSKYSASIEYLIDFQVFQRKQSYDSNPPVSLSLPLKVLQSPLKPTRLNHVFPLLEQEVNVSHSFCICFSSKSFKFSANWPRNAFKADEYANISLKLSFSSGFGISYLKGISVKLVRELNLCVDGQFFRTVDPVAKSKFKAKCAPLPASTTPFDFGTSTTIQMPSGLDPTLSTSSIDCRYFFVFEIDFKGYDTVLMASEVIIVH